MLTRQPGQVLVIDGGRIIVKIAAVEGKQVRVGVEAPREVSVHRGEVWERSKS